ncbi:MAG: hypothetical protein LBM71_00100 [Elusimicrobiota bacterium]|jgi:formate hydrogenlyase subunit 3/multisubunit Na+/H+ antiporter MnhD subunit|nr:hypothetical protein [Elusimicrobiota bacterium]
MIPFFPLVFPLACIVFLLAFKKYMPNTPKFLAFAGTTLSLVAVFTVQGTESLKIFQDGVLPTPFALAIAVFIAFFATLAALAALRETKSPSFYFNILLSTAFALGAVLSNNFIMMLLFWEGLLISLYLFILPINAKTALKAFLINAAGDVVLLVGICLFYLQNGTLDFTFFAKTNTLLTSSGLWAFILMFTGAVAKAGAFPFHNWIEPAAMQMPASFTAMLPAAIEKLLAVFLMGKMFLIFFPILPATAKVFVCALGIITIAVAAINMLVFKDIKQLLAWNIVMQIGLLVLGMGVHIFDHLLHDTLFVLNHGIFKAALLACAFFTAGAFKLYFGSTDIEELKGTARHAPLMTFVLFICALGLSGLSFVDIFFMPSALVADTYAAMPILIIIPALAAFITMFTFAKVFFALLVKKSRAKAEGSHIYNTVVFLSFLPVLFFTFGFEFSLEPFLAPHFAGINLSWVSIFNILVLLLALALAVKVKLPSYKIKHNTYTITIEAITVFTKWLYKIDRFMDKLIDTWPSAIVKKISLFFSRAHRGNTPQYLLWAILGLLIFAALVSDWGIK